MSVSGGGDSLFVSPDTLVLNSELDFFQNDYAQPGQHQRHTTYAQEPSNTHHRSVWEASQNHQQRPSLPLQGTEWGMHQALRSGLPPTPLSPFRPPRELSEDEKLAFPCTGSVVDCWNTELCPKHRDAAKQHQRQHSTSTTPDLTQTGVLPNPRRRSAPASDIEPRPTKMKRISTTAELEEADDDADMLQARTAAHVTIRRDSRQSLSKGRVPHNLVERRYRDNLNNQIEALRVTLPSLKDAVPADFEDTLSPRMPSKAVIISTAATYIKDMENERTRLLAANKALQEQVSGLQKLIRCDDCNVLQYFNAMQVSTTHLPTPS